MTLIKVNIRGKEIGDKYAFQLILGIIGFFILLFISGPEQVWFWVLDTFFIYTASILLFFTLMYGFIHETFTFFYIFLMILGAVMLIAYVVFVQKDAVETVAAVVKALVWAALFSVIFDQLRKRVDF
jgi:hypothetical protein